MGAAVSIISEQGLRKILPDAEIKATNIHVRKNSLAGSDPSYSQVWRPEQEIDPLCDEGR